MIYTNCGKVTENNECLGWILFKIKNNFHWLREKGSPSTLDKSYFRPIKECYNCKGSLQFIARKSCTFKKIK